VRYNRFAPGTDYAKLVAEEISLASDTQVPSLIIREAGWDSTTGITATDQKKDLKQLIAVPLVLRAMSDLTKLQCEHYNQISREGSADV
jgi:hypothetical protein